MVLFGASFVSNKIFFSFIKNFNNKLKDPRISILFIESKIKILRTEKDNIVLINLIPFFPQFAFFGLGFLAGFLGVLFNSLIMMGFAGLMLVLGALLFNPKAYYEVFVKGLKKLGYDKNNLKYLSHEQIIRRGLL